MAYQKKYYFTFKQIGTDIVNTVEIWQDTAEVLTAEEVIGMTSPFTSELNDLDHKFSPVLGQGCEIGLLSETDRKFFNGLYHVDAQEFMVKHYIGSDLNYIGYLNSEMYIEPYDSSVNYGTSITGNDGLAIADRFTFVQDDESHYTELLTEWDILMICLNKIGLPWDEIRICISTDFAGFSNSPNVTVLHETYISAANYYDEDDFPMTIREVMESILQPYGAQLLIRNGHVYIIDIHSRTIGIDSGFATPPVFKRFNFATGAYISDLGISINKVIQSIGYSGTGQSIELSGGVNKQVVSYSPYPTDTVINNTLVGLDEFSGIPATWTARQDYFFKILTGNTFLQLNAAYPDANFESSYYDGTVDGRSVQNNYDGYLRYQAAALPADIAEFKNPYYVSISSKPTITVDGELQGASIAIKFDYLPTFTDSKVYRYMVKESGHLALRLYFKLSIGNLFYDGETGNWVADSSKSFYLEFEDRSLEAWYNVEHLINVGDVNSDVLLSGDLNFYVTSKVEYYRIIKGPDNNSWESADAIYNSSRWRQMMIWMKNLNIDVKNDDNTDIPDDDVEYVGILNEKFKNAGEKIELTTGTDTYSSDRAKMLYFNGIDFKSIKEWTRAGQTYKIEELFLNSLVSNYRFGFIKLNNMRLRQSFDILNVFTDNNIPGKVFMLKSAKFDYEMNDVECSFWEVSPDRLTIVK
jgi:hypothetical protein